jgi:hypothetical protein
MDFFLSGFKPVITCQISSRSDPTIFGNDNLSIKLMHLWNGNIDMEMTL